VHSQQEQGGTVRFAQLQCSLFTSQHTASIFPPTH